MKKKFFLLLLLLFLNLAGCDRPNDNVSNEKSNSTEQELVDPNKNLKAIFEGSHEAKVHLIVYESLTCSHCASFHKDVYPDLKKKFIDKGLVKIEFRNFPLDMAALNASKIAHCKNDGSSEILHILFSNQKKWVKGENIEDLNSNLKKLVEDKNLNINFEKCINDKNIEDFILNTRIKGMKKFEVNATPTIIINNKKFDKPINFKNLKKTIEKLI